MRVDLISHLHRQEEWSRKTFGPGQRTEGIIAHIRSELQEIQNSPKDVEEWIDVVILALDGASRAGYSPEEIATTLVAKFHKNTKRAWPDWRTVSEDKPIEHLK